MDYIVTLHYDPIWKALEWAKENCPSYTTNTLRHSGEWEPKEVYIDYYFGNSGDAVAFALNWK